MDKSRVVSKTWISPLGKSISACTHANIWITQICAYTHAYMDFPDGEIRIFGTSLDFSIGEILVATQIRISTLEKSIFVAPVWISPLENPDWCQKLGFIHQRNPYLLPHMHKFG
tara:strand:+ start:232 stop:573 length:342 start_codon:yes stop_codon:yes gene_type:complete